VDLVAHTTTTVGVSGYFPPQPRAGLQFSSNGLFLAYAEGTNDVFSGRNIYLHNFQAGTDLLVSPNFNSRYLIDAGSDSPVISPDGRYIAYRSAPQTLLRRILTKPPTFSFMMFQTMPPSW